MEKLVASAAVAAAGVIAALRLRRDVNSFGVGPLPVYRLRDEAEQAADGISGPRRYRSIVLEADDGDVVTFTVSLPVVHTAAPLPVLVVLSGFKTAEKNLGVIPRHGANAWISYNYPYDKQRWKKGSLLTRFQIARNVARRIANQVAGLVAWLKGQAWADSSRISLLGISLGAILLPAIQHRVQIAGYSVGPSVLAYGGVGTRTLCRANMQVIKNPLQRALAASLAAHVVKPLDPERHLPYISGEFLLISSASDPRIPRETVEALHALTPDPKTVVMLQGDNAHIHSQRQDLIEEVVETTRHWLAERNAINA